MADYGETDKKKQRIALISICSLILVAMVVAVTVGVHLNKNEKAPTGGNNKGELSTSNKAVQAICQPTDYKQACVDSLSTVNSTDPKELVKAGFKVAMEHISKAAKTSVTLRAIEKDNRASQALENCNELMEYAINDLKASFEQVGEFDISKMDKIVADIKVWLSAAITYQVTCLDGFKNTTGVAGENMRKALNASAMITSNGLAMVSELQTIVSALQIPGFSRRRLLSPDLPILGHDGFPDWFENDRLGGRARKLLQATPNTIKPNAVVAKDGSGDYKTIREAIDVIPKKNKETFVIYIKAGVYDEHVLINSSLTHVMMIGDGPTKTIITGSKSYIGGYQTFKTASTAISGDFFIAKDIGFDNSAGPTMHQAVALRVGGDKSVFQNCHFTGYQDTLYVHVKRQFFRDCTITGTIDFIFGDSEAVFQSCTMLVRKPLPNQRNAVTAQGRTDPRGKGAIVMQNCKIIADPTLFPVRKEFTSYLGRPWKVYSRTIIMESFIDDLIHPDGWGIWEGNFALDTCYYAEFKNRGPGSPKAKRVRWPGIKALNAQKALEFTAGKYIEGDTWVPAITGPSSYTSGMIKKYA